jgi:hypothetical protein
MRIGKIISGGQTGVDRAALDAALECGVPIGGWCPRGRLAEDGIIPERYPLLEMRSRRYSARTRKNIESADFTLILIIDPADFVGGTRLTREICSRLRAHDGKPFTIALLNADGLAQARRDLSQLPDTGVLNVAGPRESQRPGIYLQAKSFIEQLLRQEEF